MVLEQVHTEAERHQRVSQGSITSFEDSYKQTQYVSALVVTICGFILFWELEKTQFTQERLLAFRIGFTIVFLVFCLNIAIVYSISKHVSTVYEIMAGAKRRRQNVTVQKSQAYDYHLDKLPKMSLIINIFRISLVILVLAVCIILVSKHSIVNRPMFIAIIGCTTVSLGLIGWHRGN